MTITTGQVTAYVYLLQVMIFCHTVKLRMWLPYTLLLCILLQRMQYKVLILASEH